MRVAIVGAGPAGLMAAICAAKKEASVTLYEKQDIVGKKLLITGKGRCNITNDCSVEELVAAFAPNEKFLYSAFNSFDSKDAISFMNQLGVMTKVERGRRVFPVSDDATEVRDALLRHAKENGVKVKKSAPVTKLDVADGVIVGVFTKDGKESYDRVIITTGGASYPLTGSTGDGYALAKEVSHSIIEPLPALVPLETVEEWPKEIMGLSLKKVTLSLYENDKYIASEFGEMLFTHFGISGPLVLTLSRYICTAQRKKKDISRFSLRLDLKPALSEETLDARVQRDLIEASKKQVKNSLSKLLPQSIIPCVIELSRVNPESAANQMIKADREKLVHTIKNLHMTIKSTRPLKEAIVTSGGIKLSEVNPKTMESKIVKGLYFAGEVLDIDAVTGGYNIQAALSCGFIAGNACVE